MQIGLLEDNPAIATLLSTVLTMAGHSVCPSYDGASFLAGLFASDHIPRSIPYDLLLIDLYLPGCLSGWEVVSSIRDVIPAEKLPILVVEMFAEAIPTPSSATIISRWGSHDALRVRRSRRCTSDPRACRAALRRASCTAAKISSAIAGGVISSIQAAVSSETRHST